MDFDSIPEMHELLNFKFSDSYIVFSILIFNPEILSRQKDNGFISLVLWILFYILSLK